MSSPNRLGDALGLGGDDSQDRRTILAGTGQNVIGLGVFVIASFGMNILIAQRVRQGVRGVRPDHRGDAARVRRRAPPPGSAWTWPPCGASRSRWARARRRVARRSYASPSRSRSPCRWSSVCWRSLFAPAIASLMNAPTGAYRAAAIALVFVALAQVYLGGSRGLKIMRHTLYAYWIGQSIGWIVFTLIAVGGLPEDRRRDGARVRRCRGSFATVVAWFFWRKESGRFKEHLPAEAGEAASVDPVRRAARARRAAVSQALFYTDLVRARRIKLPRRRSVAQRLRGVRPRVAGAGAVPDRGVVHVQPVRGRPPRTRRARPAERALQDDHAMDAGAAPSRCCCCS